MEEKISIIVPCYNMEQYIDRCIQSLLRQTIGLENMELIFVNDCSSDHTYERLLQWENRYDNIVVINCEENGGSGRARNLGMQYANGDYIGFVDADDWIEPDMYEKLYNAITVSGCDLVQCNSVRDKDERYAFPKSREEAKKAILIEIKSQDEREELIARGVVSGYPWNKLYIKKLLLENEIYFLEKTAYEDLFFLGLLPMYVNRIYILCEELYHYFYNPQSQSSMENSNHHKQLLDVSLTRLVEYQKRGLIDKYRRGITVDFIRRYYLNGIVTFANKMPGFTLEDFKKIRCTLLENVGDTYKDEEILQYFDIGERSLISLLDYDIEEDMWKGILKQLRGIVEKKCVIVIEGKRFDYHYKIAEFLQAQLEEWEYQGRVVDISTGNEDYEYYREITNTNPQLMIVLDMAGFRFSSELEEPSYNTIGCRMVNIVFTPLREYENYWRGNLNFSMFFYSGDKAGIGYFSNKYPDIPNLIYKEGLSRAKQKKVGDYQRTASEVLGQYMETVELKL